MPKPTVPYIRWSEGNLDTHYQKRITIDAGCFEDLMGIDPPPMTKEQYRQRSLDTVADAWAEFEAERWEPTFREYSELRANFVDDDLVCSITDIERNTFITCYHDNHPSGKHFHPKHHDNNQSEAAVGNRRLKYREKIKRELKGKQLINYKAIRGVPNV